MKKIKIILFTLIFTLSFSIQSNSKTVPASFADLAERLMPSVVNISSTQTVVTNTNPSLPFQFPPGSPLEDMFKEFGTPQERQSAALGSGFIIDESGIVVTNNHVIQGAEDIIVRVNGDEEFKAKVLGADPLMDIAVLQLETDEKFIPVSFGDSDKARIGDWVIAIGNPFGLGGTVTSGIISARNRSIGLSRYEDFIQTDASINSGNSGGPLFDLEGNVIGINTAILGRNGSIGIGFSIPSNSAKTVISQLIEFGETKRGWLGVRIQYVTQEIADAEELDEPRGALVVSVAENSPSDKAGIKDGDIILEFNGEKIKQMKELPAIVAKTEVGKNVKVKVWRNKNELTKNVILGRLETSEDFNIGKKQEPVNKQTSKIESLKITVRALTKDDIKNRKLPNQTSGLVVTKIENNSPLAKSLEVNSIITHAQKKKIRSINDLIQITEDVLNSNQKTILLAIYNNQNQRRYIGVNLD
jgi:serine protease Do